MKELLESENRSLEPLDLLQIVSAIATIIAMPVQFLLVADYHNAIFAAPGPVAVLLFLLYRALRPKPRLSQLKIFAGVRPIGDDEMWPREKIGAAVRERLQGESETTFFTGRSGAGKSTLFKTQVHPRLRKAGWRIILITRYTDPAQELAREFGRLSVITIEEMRELRFSTAQIATTRKPLLIVFDQLEQVVAEKTETQEWVGRFMIYAQSDPNIRIAAILRQEFLYELRTLGSIVPSPSKFYEIPGLDRRASTEDMREARSALDMVANREVADELLAELDSDSGKPAYSARSGLVLPIELQIAGEVLEREWKAQHRSKVDRAQYSLLGGTRSALIRRYFDAYINASPVPHVTSMVLFALAISPPPKSLSIQQLARTTFSAPKLVERVVMFLAGHKLVQPVDPVDENSFQLTHDALASLYREAAPARLSVGVREAIMYGIENPNAGKIRSLISARPHIWASGVVFLLMAVAILARLALTFRGYDNPAFPYAIVAPAHLAWAFFMYHLTRNIFVRLPGAWAWLWVLFAIFGSASLLQAMYQPVMWIFAMGMTGFAVGLAFWLVSLRRRQTDLGREEYRRVGYNFVGVAIIMMLSGKAFSDIVDKCDEVQPLLLVVGAAMSAGFVFLSVVSTAKYAAERPATVWLSLADRV